MINDEEIRNEFELLKNRKIAYFDYAATAVMPNRVIEKWVEYQKNVTVFYGKGNHVLAKEAAEIFADAETVLYDHFGVAEEYELIYGKNTTELINLMALSLQNQILPLDYILIGPYEHHSNLLPWKYLAKKTQAIFLEMPLTEEGDIDYGYLESIRDLVKVVAFSSISNTTAYRMDIPKICEIFDRAHVFVDESQQIAHQKIEQNRNITGYMLTSHKMYGPKNIAGAFIRRSFLEQIDPVLLGGGMVNAIGFEDTWGDGKHKFEAGTLDIGLIAAWAEACRFVREIGYDTIEAFESFCYHTVRSALKAGSGIRILGEEEHCSKSLLSFVCEQHHAHDVEYFFDQNNVIIRSGNLCAQPSIRKLGETAVNRISFGLGISNEDINRLCNLIGEL